MSTFNNNGVTMKGMVIIASLLAGGTLTFTRLAVGDGYLPNGQTVSTTEKLVNHLFDVPILSVESDSVAHATVKGVFNNKDLNTGFYYRELGLYAINPITGAEELFCYGNAGDDAEPINAAGQGSLIEKEIHLVTLIGNATNVTALFDEKATVLKSEFDALMPLKADLDDTPENGGRVLASQMRFEQSQVMYVDAAASSGGDGSEAKPFKTVTEAINARYLGAAVIYINIKPGTYPEKINIPRSPGTTWRLVRNGSGVVSIQGALIDNCSYVVLEGLTFNVPADGDNYGVNLTNVSNASFTDVTINGRSDKVGLSFQNSRGRIVRTVINNSSIALAVNDSSVVYAYETSGTGNTIGLQSTAAIIITAAQTIQAETLYVRLVNGVINPASWQYISDSTTDVTTLPAGIYTIRNGRAEQGLPANYDGTLIVDDLTGHKHMMFFYDAQSKIFHRIMKSDGTGWNDWEEYNPTATPATFGLLRTTSVEDEQNCQCNDAAVTPESLYKLSDYRRANTTYQVGDVVGVPYHANLYMQCIATGITDSEALDTTSAYDGQQIIDGGATWEVGVIGKTPGEIIMYMGDTAPEGYLACDHGEVSRTTYARLFHIRGTKDGAGNGSTTFNLPNMNNGSFAEGSNTAGTVKSAGLPNANGIVGFHYGFDKNNAIVLGTMHGDGAFREMTERPWGRIWKSSYLTDGSGLDSALQNHAEMFMDLSKSNAIYGNSNTVQPKSVTVKFCIKY